MEFKASQRAWVMNSRQPNSNEARQQQHTEENEQANLSQLEEQQIQLKRKIQQLIDVKDRLLVQKDAAKLCVAESIKDFHEQMELVLREKVTLDQLGPELKSIDRASLALQIDVNKTKISRQQREQEEKELQQRMSAKLSSHRSSPSKARQDSQSPIGRSMSPMNVEGNQ